MTQRLSIDAFTLTSETSEAVLGLKNLPGFFRATIHQHAGGLAAAVKHFADHSAAKVIIVEDDGDAAQLDHRLEGLSHVVEPGRKLIVIGSVNDIAYYRRLVAMGVSEYLLSPAQIGDLASAVEHVTQDHHAANKGKLFTFIGARGGTGNSTVAQHVAWSVAQKGLRTILVDLDLLSGTAALAFNEEPRQSLLEALLDPDRLDPVLLQRFMVGSDENLQILSTGAPSRSTTPVSQMAVEKLIDLSRQMADIIIIDHPHLWQPWSDDLLVLADETLVTITLDLANLRDARNLMDYLRVKRGEGREPKLIVNKADMAKRSRLTAKDAVTALSTKPLAQIPFDPVAFIEAVNDGKMVSEKYRKHKATAAFQQVAVALSGKSAASRKLFVLPPWLNRPAKPARA